MICSDWKSYKRSVWSVKYSKELTSSIETLTIEWNTAGFTGFALIRTSKMNLSATDELLFATSNVSKRLSSAWLLKFDLICISPDDLFKVSQSEIASHMNSFNNVFRSTRKEVINVIFNVDVMTKKCSFRANLVKYVIPWGHFI